MKTQTDNSNIVVHTESLEHAALTQYVINSYSPSFDGTIELYIKGTELGAHWQKEQLQPLIESHGELLRCLLATQSDYKFDGLISEQTAKDIREAIEKANNIKT